MDLQVECRGQDPIQKSVFMLVGAGISDTFKKETVFY